MALNATTYRDEAAPATRQRPLRIMVVGLRGLVGVQGGIETHARQLYPLLARLGCEIEVLHRSPYYQLADRRPRWHGLTLTYVWSPVIPVLETAVHTLLCVLYAAFRRPDILHIHAVGPGLLAPLARLFGLRVVLTHHGQDYKREKWGSLAKSVLRAGEKFGVRFANRSIAVSPAIREEIEMRHGIDATMIPNGAPHARHRRAGDVLARFELTKRRYVLCVGRIDPGKRQLDLIEAFERARINGWKLAIVGGAPPKDAYLARLEERANFNPDIVLTGYQEGPALRELYSHAGLFVLPSAAEGHPIALLEAASYGVPIFASAIPANLFVPLPRDRFFPVGDTTALAKLLRRAVGDPAAIRQGCQSVIAAMRVGYSWRGAARRTRSVYSSVAKPVSNEHG